MAGSGDDRPAADPADDRTSADAARDAFLRWLDGPDDRPAPADTDTGPASHSRTWGQLQLTVDVAADGRRTYEIRHAADADRPIAELTAYDTPEAATDLVRFDDDDRYRPLKTAPTLPTGWVFSGLDAEALIETVESVYPATIANWHRERVGELDVTHWEDATARQTGMYAVTSELSGEQVAWLADACCVDSQCVKRREWDEHEGDSLGVPRGDGAFPCREPCSIVVAAAREIAVAARADESGGDDLDDLDDLDNLDDLDDLDNLDNLNESADSGPVPGSLTLSAAEREQLFRIVDAVADGEVTDVRDGDLGDGANRLRVRYLRAKLRSTGQYPAEDGDEDAT